MADQFKEIEIEITNVQTEEKQNTDASVTTIEIINTNGTATVSNLKEAAGINMINESQLTDKQKKIALQIYEPAKEALKTLFSPDQQLNNMLKVTKIVSSLAKLLETASISKKTLTGEDKKAVAIELGRILIKDITSNDNPEILVIYDIVAEPTLETMIDVSKSVNVAVKTGSWKCCF